MRVEGSIVDAYELAEAYMLEHGFGYNCHDAFIEKPETLII